MLNDLSGFVNKKGGIQGVDFIYKCSVQADVCLHLWLGRDRAFLSGNGK
jgi:hypothetical protein